MVRIISFLVFFVCTTLSAQSPYETGMQKAFALWGEGKATEASAMFERIASAEKTNWLPSYYVGLVNVTESFMTQDKEKISALLKKAQEGLEMSASLTKDNAEIYILDALIQTAWVVYDPQTNGMKLSGKVQQLYAKALALEPNNPRAVFGKADFAMGGARYFGEDTKPMCAEIERSIGLFATFKPETPFHPSWGLERAQQVLAECKQ